MHVYLVHALHDGSPWLMGACVLLFAGVVVGVFTESGSGISSHPYTKPGSGGELAADLPRESLGRAQVEPLLRPRAVRRGRGRR